MLELREKISASYNVILEFNIMHETEEKSSDELVHHYRRGNSSKLADAL